VSGLPGAALFAGLDRSRSLSFGRRNLPVGVYGQLRSATEEAHASPTCLAPGQAVRAAEQQASQLTQMGRANGGSRRSARILTLIATRETATDRERWRIHNPGKSSVLEFHRAVTELLLTTN
jgi:hypothetical protein